MSDSQEVSLNKLEELSKIRDTKQAEWLRVILLMASSLLGILISLHKPDITDKCVRHIFGFSISFLGLGILSGGITLYGVVFLAKHQFRKMSELLQSQENGEFGQMIMIYKPSFSLPYKIFSICEKICYVCFGLSIIFLIIYSFLIG